MAQSGHGFSVDPTTPLPTGTFSNDPTPSRESKGELLALPLLVLDLMG